MSRKPSHAIHTLVRWRAFQEALAERECQQASAHVVKAQSAVDEAQAKADAIENRRDALLAEPAIDLGIACAIAHSVALRILSRSMRSTSAKRRNMV